MAYQEPKTKFHLHKSSCYRNQIRRDIIELVPEGKNKVLDIGCGSGNTIRILKETNRAIEAIGIDIINAVIPQNLEYIDRFICRDVEEVLSGMQNSDFDVIICGDILEHLIDPWATIRDLVGILKKKGIMIVSLPNIRFIKVLLPLLLFGRFNYAKQGVLDKAHLRFFTKSSAIEMLKGAGLRVLKVRTKMAGKWKLANYMTLGLFRGFFTVQYIIKCTL